VVDVRLDREKHHLGVPVLGLDGSDAVEPVVPTQLWIDQHHVWSRAGDHGRQLLGRAGLSHDADVVAGLEDDPDALERYQLIVSEQHAHS
jgi:hypothetical protein